MMMTSSSAQMLLLSTPAQAQRPYPRSLWSHQALNPVSPHFIVPQIIPPPRTHRHRRAHASTCPQRHTRTRPHTCTLKPLFSLSPALHCLSFSMCCCRLQQWHSAGMFAFVCLAHWKAMNDLTHLLSSLAAICTSGPSR